MYSLYISLPSRDLDTRQAQMTATLAHYRETYGPLTWQTIMLDNLSPTTHDLAQTLCHDTSQHDDTSLLAEITSTIDIWDDERVRTIDSDIRSRLPHAGRYRYVLPVHTLDLQYHADAGYPGALIHIRELARDLLRHKDHQTHYHIDLTARASDIHSPDTADAYLRSRPAHQLFAAILHSGLLNGVSLGYEYESAAARDAYQLMQSLISDAGYVRHHRYHYAARGQYSIHQTTYDSYSPYLGIGPGAVSMTRTTNYGTPDEDAIRGHTRSQPDSIDLSTQHTQQNQTNKSNKQQPTPLTRDDYLTNELLQRLSSIIGINDRDRYATILVPDYHDMLDQLTEQGLLATSQTSGITRVTDEGWETNEKIHYLLISNL